MVINNSAWIYPKAIVSEDDGNNNNNKGTILRFVLSPSL